MTHDSKLKLLWLIAQPQIHCTPFSVLAIKEVWITYLRPQKTSSEPLNNKNYYHNTENIETKCLNHIILVQLGIWQGLQVPKGLQMSNLHFGLKDISRGKR